MFYELLAGMNDWDKQELYLQGAETYYYLNQVGHTPATSAELWFSVAFPTTQVFALATRRVVRAS